MWSGKKLLQNYSQKINLMLQEFKFIRKKETLSSTYEIYFQWSL